MRCNIMIVLYALVAQACSEELPTSRTGDPQVLAERLIDRAWDAKPVTSPSPYFDNTTHSKVVGRPEMALRGPLSSALLPRPRAAVRRATVPSATRAAFPRGVRSFALLPRIGAPSRRDASQVPRASDAADASGVGQWPAQYRSIVDRGLRPILPQEAFAMVFAEVDPAVLVDVRMAEKFKEFPLEGALNVPFFRRIEGNSARQIFRKLNSWALGVQDTERNPDFTAAFEDMPLNRTMIITCERGGLVTPNATNRDTRLPYRYTPSLKAVGLIQELGFRNLYILQGGTNGLMENQEEEEEEDE